MNNSEFNKIRAKSVMTIREIREKIRADLSADDFRKWLVSAKDIISPKPQENNEHQKTL